MAQNDYIDFNFSDLPMMFDYTFDEIDYSLKIYYNEVNDSFYVDLYDENMVLIVAGEKLVYGMELWSAINDPRLPQTQLIPFDEDQQETEVSKLNLPDIVRLYIVDTDVPDDDNMVVMDSGDLDDEDNAEPSSDVDLNDYGNDDIVGGDEP